MSSQPFVSSCLKSVLSLLVQSTFLFATCTAQSGHDENRQPPYQKLIDFANRTRISVNWTDDSHFWYSTTDETGKSSFTYVDCQAKSKQQFETLEAMSKSLGWGENGANRSLKKVEPSESWGADRVDITFRNECEGNIDLYWVTNDFRPRHYGSLATGSTLAQSSYLGHAWAAVNDQGEVVWAGRVTSKDQTLAISKSPMEVQPRFLRSIQRDRTRRGVAPAVDSDSSSERGDSQRSSRWSVTIENDNLLFRSPDGTAEFSTQQVESIRGVPGNSYLPQQPLWSPDGTKAIVEQTREGMNREVTLIESTPKDQLQPKSRPIPYDKPGDEIDVVQLRLVDFAKKTIVPVFHESMANQWSISEVRWDTDNSRVLFLFNQRGHQRLCLMSVDAETGETKPLIDEVSPTYIDYAAKAFRQYLDDSKELIWGSERDGWYHLYLYDLTTGALKNQITKGNWVVRSIEHIDPERREIWFYAGGIASTQDPYYRHLCRVSFDGSQLTQITAGDGDHECSFSPDRTYVVDRYSRVDAAPIYELRDTRTGNLVLSLESWNAEEIWKSGISQPERFSTKGRDGTTDIYGIIVRPSDFDPSKKYPVIEQIYAGPQDSFVPKQFSPLLNFRSLADQGFIVVQIDGMGTSNRSKAFHDVSYRNLSDGGFPDRKLWLQAAAALHPEMDIGRVGIFGGSAGGQNALAALLFHGDFYDAAVADCGCHDNRLDKIWWNELYMGWPIGPHYEANSNVANAHRLQGKLMLVVGELDSNVDPASTLQVVDALIRADKDFDLLFIPGAGHGAGGSSYGIRRRDAFFREHLQGR